MTRPKFIGRRHGFSLIELQVVISILGLLMAIGIPAVGRAREGSRQAECKNHLRQLGVALHNQTSQTGLFPKDGQNGWEFGVFLLPMLEEAGLFNTLNPLTVMIPSPTTATPGKTDGVFAVYLCPTFSAPPRLPSGFGRSTYRGTQDLFARKTRPTDVLDGESAAIACGETDIDHAWALPGLGTAADLPNGGGASEVSTTAARPSSCAMDRSIFSPNQSTQRRLPPFSPRRHATWSESSDSLF